MKEIKKKRQTKKAAEKKKRWVKKIAKEKNK